MHLRLVYPAFVMNYRRDCWWYCSFNLFRRFLIILIASMPSKEAEVTATVLAICVGIIFAVHLFVQPMHWKVNNWGETYVWFIALIIATLNITDFESIEDDDEKYMFETIMLVLVLLLFAPMLVLLVPFVASKLPWDFHCDKRAQSDEDEAEAEADATSPLPEADEEEEKHEQEEKEAGRAEGADDEEEEDGGVF